MSNPVHDKSRSRGIGPDMSPEAIEGRLDIVSHLREVFLWLGTAKKVEGEAKDRVTGPPEPPNG